MNVLLALALILTGALKAGAEPPAYAGSRKCAMCHKGERNNQVFERWQESRHAEAWKVLGTDRAAEIARDMQVEGDPREAASCLKCHITGHDASPERSQKLNREDGVSCEACHGPGAEYAKKPIMLDREKAIAHGLEADPAATCIRCHDTSLSHVKAFDYDERWERIAHSVKESE